MIVNGSRFMAVRMEVDMTASIVRMKVEVQFRGLDCTPQGIDAQHDKHHGDRSVGGGNEHLGNRQPQPEHDASADEKRSCMPNAPKGSSERRSSDAVVSADNRRDCYKVIRIQSVAQS